MTENQFFTGVIEDPRIEAEKILDHKHEEFTGIANAVDPFGNKKITSIFYPDEDQQQVGSCVPHGTGKALAIERARDTTQGYQRLSWTFEYRLRPNLPQPGWWLQGAMESYRTIGAPLFTTLPDPATEDEANSAIITSQARTEAAIFKGQNYVQFAVPNNIDTIAGIASQGKGVAILFYSTYQEWASETPHIINPQLKQTDFSAQVRHCVCVLPNSGFMENGKKYVTVQDSAHFGGVTLRHVPEDFIAARVYDGGYWVSPAVLGAGPIPNHLFTKVLKVGMTSSEVIQLQKLLIAEGFLRSDCASGYFGGMTLAALHAWQNKYAKDILIPQGLDAPTDMFGSFSIAKANSLTHKI